MRATLSASTVSLLFLLLALVGLLAGCAAILDARATQREAHWEAQNPPVGRLLTLDDRQIHVLEAGQPRGAAPDLVLIHGANGNLRDFTFGLIDELAPDWRIIALDRPGLGWSDSWGEADSDPRFQAMLLRRAVDELGVDAPVVLGHSYGGAVALAWALQDPDETAALVLLGPATHPWPGSLGLWYRINETPLGRAGRALLTALAPTWLADRIVASIFEPDAMPPGYADHFGTGLSLRRASQEANNRQVNALIEHLEEMQHDYPALALPIEVVHGSADEIVGLQIHSARLDAAVPAVNLTVIDDGGHMPHHTHKSVVMQAIDRAARRAGLR